MGLYILYPENRGSCGSPKPLSDLHLTPSQTLTKQQAVTATEYGLKKLIVEGVILGVRS